jgi:flagellar biosynthesis/type III secretory pathway protein FliH
MNEHKAKQNRKTDRENFNRFVQEYLDVKDEFKKLNQDLYDEQLKQFMADFDVTEDDPIDLLEAIDDITYLTMKELNGMANALTIQVISKYPKCAKALKSTIAESLRGKYVDDVIKTWSQDISNIDKADFVNNLRTYYGLDVDADERII